MYVEDVNGYTELVKTYVIRLVIAGHIIPEHRVLVTGLDFVVLGRDLLNKFYLLSNGPEQTFAIQRQRAKPEKEDHETEPDHQGHL